MVKATFTLKSALQCCLAVFFLTALSFGLSAQTTFTYDGTTGPVPPTGTSGTATFTTNVGEFGIIGTDATLDNVLIEDLTHTFDGDLDISLISPMGTTLLLSDQNGGAGDDYTNTVFEDGGGDITAGTPPFTGTFAPEGGDFATTFAGEQINGTWTLEIIDNFGGDSGNMNAWSMQMTVSPPDQNPDCPFVDNEVACIANVNVTLNEACVARITPSMVLAGAGVECAENITITTDGGNTDMIAGCGEHTYMATVTDAFGNVTYTCWGNIFAEDKTDPTIECPEDTDAIAVEFDIQTLEGTIDLTDPSLEMNDYSCYASFFETVDGPYNYDLIEVEVSATDVYNIIVDGDVADQVLVTVYAGEFNADNPCENVLGGTEGAWAAVDFGGAAIANFFNSNFRIPLVLDAGQTYTIMVASNDPTNDYTLGIVSDNGNEVDADGISDPFKLDLEVPLFCEDVDLIRFQTPQSWVVGANGMLDRNATRALNGWTNSELEDFLEQLGRTGIPTGLDNCGPSLITLSDDLDEAGDCGDITLTRTFTIADRYDGACVGAPRTASCDQIITFARPSFINSVFEPDPTVVLPPYTAVIECDEFFETDGAVGGPDDNPTAEFAGEPFLLTASGYVAISDVYCNLGANYSDEPRIDVCDGSYKFRREWNFINWCNPSENFTYDQYVKIADYTGPVISGIAEEINVSTSPFSCVANVAIPCPTVTDGNGCSSVVATTYTVLAFGEAFFAGGTLCEGDVVQAPIGEHILIVCAEDDCGNETCEEYDLIVTDEIEPSAACDDELNVSIGGGDIANDIEGIARIFAEDVDEGSYDNCGEVTLEVRRNYWRNNTCDASANRWSPWGDFVDFYCCDIDNEITIELRVTDESGNTNVCWMVVTPEDKLNPYCYAPDNVELTCVDLPLAFPGDLEAAYDDDFAGTSIMMSAIFGNATGTDNCAVDTIVERTPNIQINECGWGTITRRFEVWQLRPEGDVNENGAIDINEVFRSTNNCSQLIEITEVHDFVIDFPEDADADCGDPDIPTIITETDGCDVLSVNIGDPVRFSATGDECYKLSITYDVINWCLWDGEYTGHVIPRMTEDDGEALPIDRAVEGNERPVVRYNDDNGLCIDRRHNDRDGDSGLDNCEDPELPNYGRYIYTQFVKVYDSTAPVVTVGEYGGPTDNCPDLVAGQFGDDDGDCEEPVSIPFSVADDCELFDNDGNLVVSIVSAELDAFAVDANEDGDIKSNEFVADLDVADLITDNGDGTYSFDGTFPIITSAMGDNVYHAVRILFEDGCGNQVSEYIVFDVIDCKGPAPVCINGLTVTLMPQEDGGCAMAIWASDFEGSPISDCTGQGPEIFLGNPRVTKYAIYRAETVEADPNFVPSPDDTGLVLTQDDEETTVVYVYAFDEEGNYDYCETYVLVQQHVDCGNDTGTINGVIATEDNETVEGVQVNVNGGEASITTNADGTYSFNLPAGGDYSVAPFLNANPLNGVSTFDLVLMSKHILGVQLLDSPYKYIAADVNSSNTITTLDMIQLRKLILNIDTEFQNNTSWRFVNAEFVFPAPSNPWLTAFPEVMNVNNLEEGALVNADFVGVKVGDVNGSAQANAQAGDDRNLNGEFNFAVENESLLAGNVYTVSFRGADMDKIAGFQGTLRLNGAELVDIEYGVATAENFGLRFVDQGMITTSWNGEATAEDVLFSLVIRATENVELSEAISINNRYTAAEAYGNGNTMNVGVVFSNGEVASAGFEVYQNTPNPFRAETMIGFNLPTDAEATLTISDASGRVLTVVRGDYAAGYNTINVTKNMVQGASGVLSYTITAGEYTVTKKMVAVK